MEHWGKIGSIGQQTPQNIINDYIDINDYIQVEAATNISSINM